jgi:hypothetical protein
VNVAVRRLAAGEGELLRAVRLRALADTPLAFGSTRDREAAWPLARWEAWAASAAEGDRQVLLLAEWPSAALAAGLASGVIDDANPALAHL